MKPESSKLYKSALGYHTQGGKPGKTEVVPTKPCKTALDLSLAYSPGVAAPCLEIKKNNKNVFAYTNKSNLVAVISNGTAVLGLGDIGALASKPVMEGKAVLFKRFANVDVFDLELKVSDNEAFIQAVKALEPTFGGINLEDIKAPDCFYIEKKLKSEMDIPVFHDDQHGTAIIIAAGLLNALEIQKKEIEKIKIVLCGAGAAAIACADLLLRFGAKRENFFITDSRGVIYKGRKEGMNPYKEAYARDTDKRSLEDVIKGSDVFIGVSVGNRLSREMVKSMAPRPIIFALANPDPEIPYPDAREVRDDLIMGTGRSDYPNQVNNVLGFPFIFRGALDVHAGSINDRMKMAAVRALADLAKMDVPESVAKAYGGAHFHFGPEYIIPKPFDPRVLFWVAPAVAQAAMDSGVAQTPIRDMEAYKEKLKTYISTNFVVMNSIIARAKGNRSRIIFSNGDNPKILEALGALREEEICEPVLIGHKELITEQAKEMDVDLTGIEIIDVYDYDINSEPNRVLYELRQRHGITKLRASYLLKNPDILGIVLLRMGEAEGMITGLAQPFKEPLLEVIEILGPSDPGRRISSIQVMTTKNDVFFFADTAVNINPDENTMVDIAQGAIRFMLSLGFEPKVAFCSFSNFDKTRYRENVKIANAMQRVARLNPEIEIEGEMQIDLAFNPEYMKRIFPFSRLKSKANLIIFPNLYASNIAYRLLLNMGQASTIGPVLLGVNGNINILHRGADVDEVVNLAALTAARLPTA